MLALRFFIKQKEVNFLYPILNIFTFLCSTNNNLLGFPHASILSNHYMASTMFLSEIYIEIFVNWINLNFSTLVKLCLINILPWTINFEKNLSCVDIGFQQLKYNINNQLESTSVVFLEFLWSVLTLHMVWLMSLVIYQGVISSLITDHVLKVWKELDKE